MITRLLVLLIFFSATAFGQFVGETNWKTEDEFRKFEAKVVEDILWLEDHPFATKTNDTKAITSYVLSWVTNAPYIYVVNESMFIGKVINDKNYKYAEKFRVTYLFGKTLYAIEHQENPDEEDAVARGLQGVLQVYEEILSVDKSAQNRELDFLKQLYDSNRLDSYVSNEIKSAGI